MSAGSLRRAPIAVLAGLLLATAVSAFALDVPPAPSQWVTDSAGLLDSSSASALNEKLRSFETDTGAQFLIYTLPSIEGGSIEDFTMRAAEKWKAGSKKYDNGLILFVFVKDRKVRLEVGYGLEGTITDAFASRVIRDFIGPKFRENDYAGGLNAGADAIITKIKGGEPAHEPTSPGAQPQGGGQPSAGGDDAFFSPLLFLVLIIFALFILPRLIMPRRRGGCGGCIWPMFFFPGGGGGITFGGGGGGWSSGGGGWGGGGGFSGGGGGFGGGGATGGW